MASHNYMGKADCVIKHLMNKQEHMYVLGLGIG